jgi:hypothetical protein
LDFECEYETNKFPDKKKVDARKSKRYELYEKALDLQLSAAKKNTKTFLSGMENMSENEIVDCIFAFAETLYKADKKRSLDKE